MDNQPVTYWDYIRVRELLDLQGGIERDESQLTQEEVVFITVHQVMELWFKMALRDLVAARDLFARPRVPDDALAGACRLIARVRTIFELMAQHFALVETLTPRDYLGFRDKLFPASGGQSAQFREIEIVMGLADASRIPYMADESYQSVLHEPDGSASWALGRVRARIEDRPTFKEAIDAWLYRTPISGSSPGDPGDDETVDRFIHAYGAAHDESLVGLADRAARMSGTPVEADAVRVRYEGQRKSATAFLAAEDVEDPEQRPVRRRIRAAAIFIETYRELPLLAWPREVVDGIIALEQRMVVFRQRHARMAELIIGRRVGTGGSTGVAYLDAVALRYRVFPDLWAVRTLLVRRDRSPEPENVEFYGFRFDTP